MSDSLGAWVPTKPACAYCFIPVPLEPWSPTQYVYVCPCCSSRWNGNTMTQTHWGSHNDYGTYLCEAWGVQWR